MAAPLPPAEVDPDRGLTDPTPRQAVFAGGCFWCVEGVFAQLDGVLDAESGYAGGAAQTATYDQVCGGDTGHAEVVRLSYDPTRITYGELLRVFFSSHDPTTLNRQGGDEGEQYRSAIFPVDDGQRAAAEAYLRQLAHTQAFQRPIVTTIEPLRAYYPAERYHQDFVRLHPDHPYVRAAALPKVAKVCALFPDRVRR